jgi:hypothetical protein
MRRNQFQFKAPPAQILARPVRPDDKYGEVANPDITNLGSGYLAKRLLGLSPQDIGYIGKSRSNSLRTNAPARIIWRKTREHRTRFRLPRLLARRGYSRATLAETVGGASFSSAKR